MNNILSLLAGLLFAYLFIWAIRNMAGRLFLFFLIGLLNVQAATYWTFKNDTGGAVDISGGGKLVSQKNSASGVGFTSFVELGSGSIGNGVTAKSAVATTWSNGDTWKIYFQYPGNVTGDPSEIIASGTYPTDFNLSGGPGGEPIYSITVNLSGAPPASYTNHVGTVSFVNTNQFGGFYTISFYTNGVLAGESSYNMTSAGAFGGTYTNDTAWTWTVTGPGGLENDFQPVVVASGSSTPVGGQSSAPPPATYTPQVTQNDPIPYLNPSTGNSNVSPIVTSIQSQGAANTAQLLAQLERNRTNSTGDGGHNYSNLLQQISTNTATMTNQLAGDGAGWSNQVSGVAGAMGTASNAFWASDVGQATEGWRDDVLGSVTNQVPTGSSDSALSYTFSNPVTGDTYRLNLDIFSFFDDSASTIGMKGKVVDWLGWLNGWILKLIPFVAFWAFARLMYGWVLELNQQALLTAGTPEVSPWKLAGKALGVVLIAGLALIVGALPTALVAAMQAGGFSFAPAVPSVVGHINEGSGLDFIAAAKRFWLFLNEAIPFTTVIFTIAHYLAFTLYGRGLMVQAYWSLRAFKWVAGAILLCFVGLQSEAASVRVLNLDTNVVVWTNAQRQLAFPPGETVLNIEDTGWEFNGEEIDLDANEFEVIYRFSRDLAGVLVADRALDEGDWSWFWMGFKLGSIMFGWAMIVNWVRQGMNAPAKYAGPPD